MESSKSVNKRICIFSILLLLIVLINFLAPLIAPYPPNDINMKNKLLISSAEHPLGTDHLGRDILSRIMYGGRSSIILAVAATCLSMLAGLIIGLAAGYFGGVVDVVLTLISNIFQGLPGMTMMIALVGILGPGTHSLILALVITSWVGFSRFVRGEVMKAKQENYVEGIRCFGAGHIYIMFHTILPNICGNILILFTTRLGRVVLSVAGLSYLGLGIQPPTPDWGAMITEARRYFRSAPNMLIAPGVCIIIFSLFINLLGDALRDKFDVRNDQVKDW